METKLTREYAEKLAIESLKKDWQHLFVGGHIPTIQNLPSHPLSIVVNQVEGYMKAIEETNAKGLLEACKWAVEQFKRLADEGRYPEFMLSQNGGDGVMPLVEAIKKASI